MCERARKGVLRPGGESACRQRRDSCRRVRAPLATGLPAAGARGGRSLPASSQRDPITSVRRRPRAQTDDPAHRQIKGWRKGPIQALKGLWKVLAKRVPEREPGRSSEGPEISGLRGRASAYGPGLPRLRRGQEPPAAAHGPSPQPSASEPLKSASGSPPEECVSSFQGLQSSNEAGHRAKCFIDLGCIRDESPTPGHASGARRLRTPAGSCAQTAQAGKGALGTKGRFRRRGPQSQLLPHGRRPTVVQVSFREAS